MRRGRSTAGPGFPSTSPPPAAPLPVTLAPPQLQRQVVSVLRGEESSQLPEVPSDACQQLHRELLPHFQPAVLLRETKELSAVVVFAFFSVAQCVAPVVYGLRKEELMEQLSHRFPCCSRYLKSALGWTVSVNWTRNNHKSRYVPDGRIHEILFGGQAAKPPLCFNFFLPIYYYLFTLPLKSPSPPHFKFSLNYDFWSRDFPPF